MPTKRRVAQMFPKALGAALGYAVARMMPEDNAIPIMVGGAAFAGTAFMKSGAMSDAIEAAALTLPNQAVNHYLDQWMDGEEAGKSMTAADKAELERVRDELQNAARAIEALQQQAVAQAGYYNLPGHAGAHLHVIPGGYAEAGCPPEMAGEAHLVAIPG